MRFVHCVIYGAILGVISFVIGRILPKKWFSYEAFPYKQFKWEQGGAVYNRLRIRKWQKAVPDMSRIFSRWMPPKKLSGCPNAETLELMLQETCIAEFTHGWLCVAGLACIRIWPGPGGVILTFVYIALGNLPFILIQRYNRLRLAKLMEKTGRKTTIATGETIYACVNTELQYRSGT